MKDVLKRDDSDVLVREFYGKRRRKSDRPKAAAAEHYSVVCISLYNEDLERLDAKVAELKRAGHRKMTRSALIRFALDQVNTRKLPKSY